MDTMQSEPASPARWSAPRPWWGRAKRVATSVAASAVLLGGGAAIGFALTGGASAATGSAAGTAAASASARHPCAQLALRLRRSGHQTAARRVRALCHIPLLRLAAVGGIYGEITFEAKAGPTTLAFERGIIKSVAGPVITVMAKDGTTWTWDLTASTAVRAAGRKVPQDKLATGDQVFIGGPVVSGVKDARLIRIAPAG